MILDGTMNGMQSQPTMTNRDTGVRTDVAALIRDVFSYQGPLRLDMLREEIPRWDSLRHVALVVAIESEFAVSLSMDEMHEIDSVHALQRVVERHNK